MLRIPINHFEGNYICDAETLAELQGEDRIVLRYVDNPNGSLDGIAGVCNEAGNVVGLMPHPERASDELLGSADGAALLRSLLSVAAWGRGLGPPGPAVWERRAVGRSAPGPGDLGLLEHRAPTPRPSARPNR